jgi:mRNA-degrading endonuclease RelE of RelBE toxin-antitoxin system
MEPYKVYLHFDLLESFPKRGRQRALVMKFIRSLGDDPYVPGDLTDRDATLRIRQIKIIGDYAVTYWVDDPVKIVMVVDVRPADK